MTDDKGKFPGFFYSAGINGAWGVSDKVKQYGNGVHRNGSAVFVALMYFDEHYPPDLASYPIINSSDAMSSIL